MRNIKDIDEAMWMNAVHPEVLLEFLCKQASHRKLRLFACSCGRRLDCADDCRTELDVSERFADGRASNKEFRRVHKQLGARGGYSAAWAANCVQHAVMQWHTDVAAKNASQAAASYWHFRSRELSPLGTVEECMEARDAELGQQATILREMFGNPFRPVALDPSWQSSSVMNIATVIYNERSFDDMPILADALEDAGCDNADILQHCRSKGPHVRGCWVVDLLLGKE